MLDADLARVYGMSTKRINGHARHQLDKGERAEVVANCDHLRDLKFSPALPLAIH
jgi:hypothetical protein